jgi:hypothetical protein
MSIIGDIRDEREDEMFKEFLVLISNNLETESIFLTSNPQTYFKVEAGEMIEAVAKIFGRSNETAGKIFNEIMDKKEN